MGYIPLEQLAVYQMAMEIGEEVWNVVDQWDSFPKNSVGKQFCEAADSIAANIAEGHGRFHFKESRNFCFYARGSLMETKSWLKKSLNRKLVDEPTFTRVSDLLSKCHYALNQYIKSIGSSGDSLQESDAVYLRSTNFEDLPFD